MFDWLFPDNVITELAAPWMWRSVLLPEEEAIVADAVDKRRREFTAGRTCAREILGRMGMGCDLAIGKDGYGAPLWPEGVVGSISHTEAVCIVSLSLRRPEMSSLGVDVEKDAGLDPDLLALVCDDRETETCFADPAENPYRLAKVIFSAKESVYKCLYPILRTMLEFHDVHIRLDIRRQVFEAMARSSSRPRFQVGTCEGKFLYAGGYIYTSCILAQSGKSVAWAPSAGGIEFVRGVGWP